MCRFVANDRKIRVEGPTSINMEWRPNACVAFWASQSWRRAISDVLRRWADKAEGQMTYTVRVKNPPGTTHDDVLDALTYGGTASVKYLNDLWRERQLDKREPTAPSTYPHEWH